MPDEEASSRWQDLHNHVVTQTSQNFVLSFLSRCIRAHTEHISVFTDPSLVPPLDLARLIPKYRHSASRLIFVDFEGCLWVRDMSKRAITEMMQNGKGPMVEPSEEAMQVLENLADDPRNEIWVLSGLPMKGALEKLAERVPGVGIVAENGCFIKTKEVRRRANGHMNGTSKANWINIVANLDFAWKGPCVEILNYVSCPFSLSLMDSLNNTDHVTVHRTYTRFICRRACCFHRVAFLDGFSRFDCIDQWGFCQLCHFTDLESGSHFNHTNYKLPI